MTLTKITAKTAGEVCGGYKLSKDAHKLLRPDHTPAQFVAALVQAGRHGDLCDFLAHALPKREAIWWACLAARHALGGELPAPERAALKAAVEWVLEPDEPKRRAAQTAGEAVDFATPAGCAALAVFGSGGSLVPANFPEVPPSPTMTGTAVAGSLALASVQGDSGADLQRELVELGLAIADGKVVWPSGAKKPAPTKRF